MAALVRRTKIAGIVTIARDEARGRPALLT
jgi:hypothetical protein